MIWTKNGPVYHVACWGGSVKRHFLDIYLTTFFEICNFGITLAMTVIFVVEMLKI